MIFDSINTLRQLRKNQYLEERDLRDLQNRQLKKIVRHSYDNVSYYRRLFDGAGITPDDIRDRDDLARIPITTKKDLQNLAEKEILARGVDPGTCVVKHTSGSTGNPQKVYLSPAERDFQILMNLRILMENGMGLTDRTAYIINPRRFPDTRHWFQRLGVLRREYLSVFDFPPKHAEILGRSRPDIIYGYPSNLALLAKFVREEGLAEIRPKRVFSVAEALEPRARDLIDDVFGVSTCDILGTIELGDIAWQCPVRKGYHLSTDAVIVEFFGNGGPAPAGEEGKIVCTSLYSYTMPLIRYAVDDICVPSDRACSCGRTLPMIESIRGRANDFILLPDGQLVASCFLVIIMQTQHSVKQYRVLQKEKDTLTVQVVKGEGFGSDVASRIKEEIEKVVEGKLSVSVDEVEEISRDRSGKIRTVISQVLEGRQVTR